MEPEDEPSASTEIISRSKRRIALLEGELEKLKNQGTNRKS
jgi:hypothetical protein